jgi:hypothetical protein
LPIDKIAQFAGEVGNPATSEPERLTVLKFLLHFVGDIHQPFHAADRKDPDQDATIEMETASAF